MPSPGRMLLIGMLVAGCVLPFCWWQSRSGIRTFEAAGGRFGSDWGFSEPWISVAGWWTLGNDGLSRVVPDGSVAYLSLHGNHFDDRWTEHLHRFSGLQSPWLVGTAMTDESLEVIGNAHFQLVSFGVRGGAPITDAGIAYLAGQTKMFWLQIEDQPHVTGKFLSSLSSAPLTYLKLRNCRSVTDDGLSELPRFKLLQQLDLSGTSVTDATLDHIATLPHLVDLWLSDTQVTAAGIQRLLQKRPGLQIDHESLRPTDIQTSR